MESNISTVAFRSNLYPVEKSFYEDSRFTSESPDTSKYYIFPGPI